VATLRLQLEGSPGAISVRAFLTAIDNAVRMLADFDAGISAEPRGSIDWLVSDLFMGSLGVDLESRSRSEDLNVGPQVVEAFVAGLTQIELQGTTPPYLSEAGMLRARRLLKLIGHDGTAGLIVTNVGQQQRIVVTARASANIDQLIPARHRALGSVEGKLETISLHSRPRFVVYHSHTRKAVTCRFGAETLLADAKEALGRRVSVKGIVHTNAKGEPLSVDAEALRVLRSEAELPRIADFLGCVPDFTDDLSTADFIESVRSG